jgi:drug/metabolite transporter (DMT)-like permease
VVFSVLPFFVVLLAWWLLPGERAAPRAAGGLVVGSGGLVVIYGKQLTLGSTGRLLGLLAITASALIAAINTVTIRRWLGAIPAVALATWTVAEGTAIIPFYALLSESGSSVQWTPSAVGALFDYEALGAGAWLRAGMVLGRDLLAPLRSTTSVRG